MKLKNLRHSPWTPITVEMLSATTRTSEKVPARKAIFEYSDIFGTRTVPSTVFVSPTSRAVWVGPEQEFYVETDSGIKGGKLNGGFLLWCDSLAQNQAVTNIDAAIREFEDGRELGELLTAKVPGYEPDRAKRFTDLRRVFSIWAFQPGKETTAIDPTAARLVALEIDGKEVKLTIENPASEFKGEAWIDAKTRKITRATEAGRKIFPK